MYSTKMVSETETGKYIEMTPKQLEGDTYFVPYNLSDIDLHFLL